MNWKKFMIACCNSFLLIICTIFPYNILGCGPDLNPYDYYTSFFKRDLPTDKSLQPFYYTGYRFLYNDIDPKPVKYVTSAEWTSYCGQNVTPHDAFEFMCKYSHSDLSSLYYNLEKNQPLKIPDSVKKNSMTQYFFNTKDLEALGYVLYAKQVEPFVLGDEGWDNANRDTARMSRLIRSGAQLWNVAKKDFIKLRYGYQVVRLNHYSGKYKECLDAYEKYIASNKSSSELQNLSVSLRAGALNRLGKKEEASYLFSKLFAASDVKKISNYMSFRFVNWGIRQKDLNLKLCKNGEERANMMGMFALNEPGIQITTIREISKLAPNSALLEVLAVREINKIEDNYFSPALEQQRSKSFYISYSDKSQNAFGEFQKEGRDLATLYHELASNSTVRNKGLYEAAAAYLSYITKNLGDARKFIASAKKMQLSPAIADQLQLTELLVTINESNKIDAGFEEKILTSIKWLWQKAKSEKKEEINYYETNPWKQFYRNLMREIIAPRYHQQGDLHKEVLALGTADKIFEVPNNENAEEYYPYYGIFETNALNFLRYELNSAQVETLYKLLQSSTATNFEKFLIQNNSLSSDDVKDFAGTAYLREYNLAKAEEWFKKIGPAYYKKDPYKTYLAANPFTDLLIDTHTATKQDTVKYTKLSFVQKLKRLESEIASGDNEKKAKASYEIAKGLYQMSYWGNSWLLVAYEWHSGSGLSSDSLLKKWEKEYYGVYKAENYYNQAFEASADKNFKAKCLFMAAKCRQKQLVVPQYNQYKNFDDYNKAYKVYADRFGENPHYFSLLKKEYAATPFYKEAWNSCTFLKDFVLRK